MNQKRILFIDDDKELLAVLNEIFSIQFDCTSFSNASEALAEIKASKSRFDCIVCDLMMPVMSGIQFYNELKNVQPSLLSQIIFLTGGSYTHETDVFLSQHEVFHCEKPVQIKAIKDMVLERLQNRN